MSFAQNLQSKRVSCKFFKGKDLELFLLVESRGGTGKMLGFFGFASE
jgi:hypothetical protein